MTITDKPVFSEICVSFDLETTGLNTETDRIIEVGAVKFRGNEVLETFQRLVQPGRKLSSFVSLLTGISDDDLEGAPPFEEIAEEFAAFLGDYAIVGQNVGFDLSVLGQAGLHPSGPVYDTRDLSRLLRPAATNHSLGDLVEAFGVVHENAHRALADAEATMQVFHALWDRLVALEPETLAMARTLALRADDGWNVKRMIEEAAHLRDAAPGGAADVIRALLTRLGQPPQPGAMSQRRLSEEGVNPKEIETAFTAGHGIATVLESYEPRPQQTAMALGVLNALEEGGTLMLEAPPGTGKTLGYLVPAVAYAREHGAPVVVATSTRGLQEQLAGKDLPTVLQALGVDTAEFRVAVLKGRGNYLCISRLGEALSRADLTPTDIPFLIRVLVWLESTENGDLGELGLSGPETGQSSRLSAGGESGHRGCAYDREGTCFLTRSRRGAQNAQLVITNHSLLLADSASGGGVLGHVKHLILDEAHHLENEATEQYGRRASYQELIDLLASLGGDSNEGRPRVAGLALGEARGSGAVNRAQEIETASVEVANEARAAMERAGAFYALLNALATRGGPDRSANDNAVRLVPRVRDSEMWRETALAWGELDARLQGLGRLIDTRFMDAARDAVTPATIHAVDDTLARLTDLRARMDSVIRDPDGDNAITWVEPPRDSRTGTVLRSAPMSVAPYLAAGLFNDREALVLTSATLTANGSFEYLRGRLGLADADELRLDSPFDAASAAAAFVPMDMPAPNDSAFSRAVEQAVVQVAEAADGGTLALFTSHMALRAAYPHVRSALQEHGITVMGQGIDGPPARLADMMRKSPRTVVLGAATFWEGIDLPGDALRALIVVRLPFSVPTDPIIEARGETYDHSFNEYSLPQSLLRFRQGTGRLIRNSTDHGVIVVLDSRVLSRAYGAAYLEALPTSTVLTPAVSDLGTSIGDWLHTGNG